MAPDEKLVVAKYDGKKVAEVKVMEQYYDGDGWCVR